MNFHQARDELLAPWQGKLVPFWLNFVENPSTWGVFVDLLTIESPVKH